MAVSNSKKRIGNALRANITGSKEIVKRLRKIKTSQRKLVRDSFFKAIKVYRREAVRGAMQYRETGYMASAYVEKTIKAPPDRIVVAAGPIRGWATSLARWLERGTKERINKKTGKSYGRITATHFQEKAWKRTAKRIKKMVEKDIFRKIAGIASIGMGRKSKLW